MTTTILVIEDNIEMRENTAELLNLAGYTVHVAADGKEGLQQAKKVRPDLILCDIMMPELDGYGVLRVIENTADLAGTPFIFLTAKAEKTDFRKAMDLGADDYLTKPFEGDDLLRMVEGRLKKSRIIKKSFENNLNGLNEFLNDAGNLIGTELLPEKRIIKKVKKKETIFSEGDSAAHVYFISNGQIKTYKSNADGKEFITGILKEGDFFGYISMFDEKGRRESAIAIDDGELISIPREDFLKILHTNDMIAMKFIKFMSNNMDEAEKRLLKLAYDSARKRVAEALLFVFRKTGAPENTFIPIARETISSIAGIAPESVSRNLSDFKEEGLIEAENGNIRICNFTKLEKIKY
ncbi:MAG TPA: response regulator [Bacteroidia bacterium]|nr:response regulator [Bacteroidia bacterium]